MSAKFALFAVLTVGVAIALLAKPSSPAPQVKEGVDELRIKLIHSDDKLARDFNNLSYYVTTIDPHGPEASPKAINAISYKASVEFQAHIELLRRYSMYDPVAALTIAPHSEQAAKRFVRATAVMALRRMSSDPDFEPSEAEVNQTVKAIMTLPI